MNMKNAPTIDNEAVAEFFGNLEECLENMVDSHYEQIEGKTFVIMTARDFYYLRNCQAQQPFINLLLEQLEDFSIQQLEHIRTLATSQLNIKMARDYFERKELA